MNHIYVDMSNTDNKFIRFRLTNINIFIIRIKFKLININMIHKLTIYVPDLLTIIITLNYGNKRRKCFRPRK